MRAIKKSKQSIDFNFIVVNYLIKFVTDYIFIHVVL